MLPQLDTSFYLSQLFWLAVCMVVLVILLKKYFIPRMNKIIEERDDFIKNRTDEINQLLLEISDLKKQINEIKEQGIKKSSNILADARNRSENALYDQLSVIKNDNEELLMSTRKRYKNEMKNIEIEINEQIKKTISENVLNALFYSKK